MASSDGAAARALDLVKKADKRLTSFSLFGGNKYEDTAELLEKAATQYKLAKCCECEKKKVSIFLFDESDRSTSDNAKEKISTAARG